MKTLKTRSFISYQSPQTSKRIRQTTHTHTNNVSVLAAICNSVNLLYSTSFASLLPSLRCISFSPLRGNVLTLTTIVTKLEVMIVTIMWLSETDIFAAMILTYRRQQFQHLKPLF